MAWGGERRQAKQLGTRPIAKVLAVRKKGGRLGGTDAGKGGGKGGIKGGVTKFKLSRLAGVETGTGKTKFRDGGNQKAGKYYPSSLRNKKYRAKSGRGGAAKGFANRSGGAPGRQRKKNHVQKGEKGKGDFGTRPRIVGKIRGKRTQLSGGKPRGGTPGGEKKPGVYQTGGEGKEVNHENRQGDGKGRGWSGWVGGKKSRRFHHVPGGYKGGGRPG